MAELRLEPLLDNVEEPIGLFCPGHVDLTEFNAAALKEAGGYHGFNACMFTLGAARHLYYSEEVDEELARSDPERAGYYQERPANWPDAKPYTVVMFVDDEHPDPALGGG